MRSCSGGFRTRDHPPGAQAPYERLPQLLEEPTSTPGWPPSQSEPPESAGHALRLSRHRGSGELAIRIGFTSGAVTFTPAQSSTVRACPSPSSELTRKEDGDSGRNALNLYSFETISQAGRSKLHLTRRHRIPKKIVINISATIMAMAVSVRAISNDEQQRKRQNKSNSCQIHKTAP